MHKPEVVLLWTKNFGNDRLFKRLLCGKPVFTMFDPDVTQAVWVVSFFDPLQYLSFQDPSASISDDEDKCILHAYNN